MALRKRPSRKTYKVKWYDKHKERLRKDARSKVSVSRKKKVAWLRAIKESSRCHTCGETHWACLDFHHIDPSKKLFTISKGMAADYGKAKIQAEINKCIVLCSNCHRKLHWAGK